MRPITYPEIAEMGGRLYPLLDGFDNSALKRARQRGSPYCWLSLSSMCRKLRIANSSRNRTILAKAKLYLSRKLGVVQFFSQFRPGERLADLFKLLSAKEIGRAKHRERHKTKPSHSETAFVLGVNCSAFVLGYPDSWDEIGMEAAC